MTNIGIVGSRRRNTDVDFSIVKQALLAIYQPGDAIVSGGCSRGADAFAEEIAADLNLPKELVKIFPANWDLGRHAGFLRNTDIAKTADVLIACVAPDRTGGTEDTIKKFQKFHPNGKLILV